MPQLRLLEHVDRRGRADPRPPCGVKRDGRQTGTVGDLFAEGRALPVRWRAHLGMSRVSAGEVPLYIGRSGDRVQRLRDHLGDGDGPACRHRTKEDGRTTASVSPRGPQPYFLKVTCTERLFVMVTTQEG